MGDASVQENRWLVLGPEPPREYRDAKGDLLETLGPIARINLFVGANNSGKSRFMRTMTGLALKEKNQRGYRFASDRRLTERIREARTAIAHVERNKAFLIAVAGDATRQLLAAGLNELNAFSRSLVTFESQGELGREPHPTATDGFMALGARLPDDVSATEEFILAQPHFAVLGRLMSALGDAWFSWKSSAGQLYIPCLRTAHPLAIDQHSLHGTDVLGQAVQVNFTLGAAQLTIHTGLRLWELMEAAPHHNTHERRRHRAFEQFLSRRFFDGAPLELVSKRGQGVERRIDVTVVWGDKVEREDPLHHLGDGINNLIVLLYPAFMAPPGSWIFIEEPENSLHPGLQRAFMRALLEEDQLWSHKFFLTTHSNHLVEHTLRCDDLSVFSFRPGFRKADALWSREFVVEHVAGYGNHLLADLGVTNASVLLANCTLWVEGITDRLYLRTYLRCYEKHLEDAGTLKKRLLEDLHYAFFEFAGSNIEHYAFDAADDDATAEKIRAQFVANRIFLLHDKDAPGDAADEDGKRAKRFERLRDEARKANASAPGRFVFQTTQGVEIENEIGSKLLLAVLDAFLARMKNKPTVTEDHRTAIGKDDYADTPLGEYLTAVLGLTPEASTFRGGNKDGRPGTLNNDYKLHLADLVTKHATWDNIGPRAQGLAEAVHAWIEAQNP